MRNRDEAEALGDEIVRHLQAATSSHHLDRRRRVDLLDHLLRLEERCAQGAWDGSSRVSRDPHADLVAGACRLWLDLGAPRETLEDRLPSWRTDDERSAIVRFAEVRVELADAGVDAARDALEAWDAVAATSDAGDPRWWAHRLVDGVASGRLSPRPAGDRDPPPGRPGERRRSPAATAHDRFTDDLCESIVRVAGEVSTQVISVQGRAAPVDAVIDGLRSALAGSDLRVVRCDLDGTGAPSPLAGWLDVLWDDVHWNLRGDVTLARVASVVDRQLGRATTRRRSGGEELDRRRGDEVLVAVLRRVLAVIPDPVVVLAAGSEPAQRWLDGLLRPIAGGDAFRLAAVHASAARADEAK